MMASAELQGRPGPDLAGWLSRVQAQVERGLGSILELEDEQNLNAQWTQATERMREYSLRSAKRLRPALMVAAHGLVTGSTEPPPGVWRFAAGFELLHTFFRVHDDVADAAEMRRGGPALHRMLAPDRMGQDLAVVAGDHLFARSLEAMLESELPEAQEVVAYVMRSCRHTAAGQFLDVQGVRVPLAEAKLRQSMKVAQLKTSRFGFIAPLVGGAMLAGAGGRLLVALERMGRNLGLAYQLRGELLALFGDPAAGVKPIDTDLLERKRSFPVLCAYARADAQDRREMEALWDGRIDASSVERARALVEKNGGRPCTERLLRRATMLTHQVLLTLPRSEASTLLSLLVVRLVERGG